MFGNSQEQQCEEGAAALEEFIFGGAPQVPSQDFQGENLRYSLHWLCLAIALLKVLF